MEQDEDSLSTDAEKESPKQHHLQFKGREGEIPRWAQIHVETTAMREANSCQQQQLHHSIRDLSKGQK